MEKTADRLARMLPVIMQEFHKFDVSFSRELDIPIIQFKVMMFVYSKGKCCLSDVSAGMH